MQTDKILKDIPYKGHSTFDLFMKGKFSDLYRTMTTLFTSKRRQPLGNSKTTPKVADSRVPISQRFTVNAHS